jgi:GNAT superfamily N-acetyltransferase
VKRSSSATIRPATREDARTCGRICFEAFRRVSTRAGFEPDFPTADYAIGIMRNLIDNPDIYAVVAELAGRIVGSNFLDERDEIRGIGPISVDPDAQGSGAGRLLMEAVLERSRAATGVRLLQDAHNPVSLSLYASLGFELREPVGLVSGRPASPPFEDVEVRPMTDSDLGRCAELCREVHGFGRLNGLRDCAPFAPQVAVRGARITAYASSLVAWPVAHGVAEREEDLHALVLGAAPDATSALSFLVPMREGGLFRWCLGEGLRTVKTMNLMTIGAYQAPRGAWFPSVLY